MGTNWNPLYPFDEAVHPLEEAARESEWEDDTLNFNKKRKEQIIDENDESETMFL